jgi:murein L,D-transpeptidase YcbB/YkuD
MKRFLFTTIALLFCPIQAVQAQDGLGWSSTDISTLKRWVDAAPLDAMSPPSTKSLDTALAAADPADIDDKATMLALQLARMHLLGCCTSSERAGWNIVDTDKEIALEPMLEKAVENNTLDTFFALLRPHHEEYAALKAAYDREADKDRREAIARNMERWRWLPHDLGTDYILVNTARFEADLWRNGVKEGTWRVIVGKKSTPTPVFDTTVTGVVLNPWWEIPASIVRESVGALVRNNPSGARARGYVWSDGRYRQRPGPNNALGQMKLVMPNPYSVYMHDTPNKNLFDEDVRAFSHGCIRTGKALGFAATLLEGAKTQEEVDAIIASGKTTTVDLVNPIHVYITYFTAASDGVGGVTVFDDFYNRDRRIKVVDTGEACAA